MASSYSTLTCTQKSSSASVKCSRFLSCWVTGFIAAEHTLNTIWGTIKWISGILWFPLVRMVRFFFFLLLPVVYASILLIVSSCADCGWIMHCLSLQKNRCKARESCRAGQIAQLKMVKTLRKGDEKNYVPKYCCLFLFFFQIESCVLQSAARHTCPWSNADAFLYIPCQWTRSWAGQKKRKKKGGGGWCWYASP